MIPCSHIGTGETNTCSSKASRNWRKGGRVWHLEKEHCNDFDIHFNVFSILVYSLREFGYKTRARLLIKSREKYSTVWFSTSKKRTNGVATALLILLCTERSLLRDANIFGRKTLTHVSQYNANCNKQLLLISSKMIFCLKSVHLSRYCVFYRVRNMDGVRWYSGTLQYTGSKHLIVTSAWYCDVMCIVTSSVLWRQFPGRWHYSKMEHGTMKFW